MQIVASAHHRAHNTRHSLPGYDSHYDEVPQRAEAILDALHAAGLGAVTEPVDHGLEPVLAVHDPGLIGFLQGAFQGSRGALGDGRPLFPSGYFAVRGWQRQPASWQHLAGYYAIDRDSPILAGTWTAAYWSAQAALTAASLARSGQRAAYALCRPPGHHASASQYGGYCYLNNAAIAARYLQDVHPYAGRRIADENRPAGSETGPSIAQTSRLRVAIVDIDYHHGNGTQAIFYADPTVLYCSLHADPDEEYPYFWGAADELGSGAAVGANRNWPLPAGADDAAYLAALDEALAVVAAFRPAFLVVSAGFDLLHGDPVATNGGFAVTPDGLAQIGQRLAGLGVPAVIVQEGGYQIDRLGELAVRFLRAFT